MKRTAPHRMRLGVAAMGLWLGVAGATAQSPAPAPNLVGNGGFEEVEAGTNRPTVWHAGDWSPPEQRGELTLSADAEGPAEGTRAAQLTYVGKGENLVVYQDLRRPGSARYVLRAQCRVPDGYFAYLSAVAFKGKSDIVQYENTERYHGDGAWHTAELAFETKPETEYFRVILRSNGNAAFDEVCLEEVPGSRAEGEPTTGRELAQKPAEPATPAAADAARKAGMSPEELAWENVLEENLGSFYLPRYKEAKAKGQVTAWDYVKDDPALPRILLIGDSISRGYTLAVRQALAGKVTVHRAPANCGPTTMGLQKLDVWLGAGKWDLIHLNFGIHDRASSPEEYAARLETIVERLKATGARLVWASSTPLTGKSIEKTGVDPIPALNAAAGKVMAKHGVATDDLYAAASALPDSVRADDGCHFQEAGYQALGKAVAECILAELGRK